MRLLIHLLSLSWLLLDIACTAAWADGGVVRLVEQQGGYRISVFTSPNPLRAGPVDISVLVQDAETGQPISDARVTVTAAPRGRSRDAVHALATTAAATNKLLQAALIELPTAGWWEVEVDCVAARGLAQVRFEMEAGPLVTHGPAMWPWFSWPAAAVLLFGIHRLLVWRKDGPTAR